MTQPPSPLATPMPWNLVASSYADEIVPMFESYAKTALQLAAPAPGARIVDVACGPGTLSVVAAQSGFVVDALDFSPAMIEHLQARIGELPITPRVGDGQALPYADGAFGAAFSMFGLMFFPDRDKGFAELRRVLAPGARAVVSTWTRMEDTPAIAAMFVALRTTFRQLLGDQAPQPGSQELPLITEEQCKTEMGAHFADVVVHRANHVQRYESVAALWASFERAMAPIALLKRSLGDRWAPAADAARTAIGKVVGTGAGEMTMTALLSVGVAR